MRYEVVLSSPTSIQFFTTRAGTIVAYDYFPAQASTTLLGLEVGDVLRCSMNVSIDGVSTWVPFGPTHTVVADGAGCRFFRTDRPMSAFTTNTPMAVVGWKSVGNPAEREAAGAAKIGISGLWILVGIMLWACYQRTRR